MIVNSPGSVSVVFTAPFDGFYTLALEVNGSQTLELNGSALSGFGAQGAFVSRGVFLEDGDEIGYQGGSAELQIGWPRSKHNTLPSPARARGGTQQ